MFLGVMYRSSNHKIISKNIFSAGAKKLDYRHRLKMNVKGFLKSFFLELQIARNADTLSVLNRDLSPPLTSFNHANICGDLTDIRKSLSIELLQNFFRDSR